MMKASLRRKLKARIIERNSTRVFVVKPEWDTCDYWLGLGDDERQEILKQSQKKGKREKIMRFAKYVDVIDFEHFYLSNHAFRAFVDRVRKRE